MTVYIWQNHGFNWAEYLLKLPFRLGYGLPPWMHYCLTVEFIMLCVFSAMMFTILLGSLVLIRRAMLALRISSQNISNKLICMHLLMNLAVDTGILLLTNDFMMISNPYKSCD